MFSFAEMGADIQYVLTGRRCGANGSSHPVDEASLAIESLLILDEELERAGVSMDRKARAMLALGGWSQVRQEAETDAEQFNLLRKLFRMTVSLHSGQPSGRAPQAARQKVKGHGNVVANGNVSGVNVGGIAVEKKGTKKKK